MCVRCGAQTGMTLEPNKTMFSPKDDPAVEPNETLNTVPASFVPPKNVVPYRVEPDKTKPAAGFAPSLLVFSGSAVKVWRTLNPVPLVLIENIVPLPFVPP